MKSILVFLFVILAVFGFAHGNVVLLKVSADGCNINGNTMKVGETLSAPGECLEYECYGPNAFSVKTCSSVQTLKQCKFIPPDNSKPYPQCCSRHEC